MKPAVAAALAAFVLAEVAQGQVERTPFTPTTIQAPFIEQFTADWTERWSTSQASKKQREDDEEAFKYDGLWVVEEPSVFPGLVGDEGLTLKSKAKQHAISSLFDKPIDPKGKPLVVQYEVKLQKGLTCGGAYLKLLTESEQGIQAEEFSDKTPYTIMFGPDKCGTTNKVHFIFRHKNPKTGEIEEKHLKNAPYPKIAKTSTLYTLIVNPDNSFEILINGDSKKKGSLLEDFQPAVNPPKEIDDPEDKKPEDWVDTPRIPDPDATKPDDWDEDAPLEIVDEEATIPDGWLEDERHDIPDPEAVKPEEWDDEEDGEWVPPMVPNPKCEEAPGCGPWTKPTIRNPAYKGKWSAPLIDNPAYKGVWAPRKVPNPDYFEDNSPADFTPIAGVGFELWTMDEDILFDNIYIGHDAEQASAFAKETFHVKLPIEQNKEEEANPKKEQEGGAAANLVEKVRGTANEFIAKARENPVEAIKEMPQVAGAFGAAFAGLLALVGLVGSALGGGGPSGARPAGKGAKKVDVKEKVDKVAAEAKSSAVQAKDSVTKRATAVASKDE
ncbi:Calreticulin-domain-containing protein [Violaceomyces palustris]|uniref:Calreticulin-domain-containing protein n=1 Tax=Violaceomyces palustris TaxID=1673888 RepID=A0ACD0NN37_9BASI|nr:Calreticulin-domain-containing protein [Violaceomyces palustris]